MGASLVLDEITGSVTRLNRQTPTWCAGRMRCGGKDVSFSVKAYCAVGDTVTIHGEWQDDPRWGRQFKGATLTRCLPLDPAGLLRWLDFNVVGVGPVRAKLLVDRYGVGLMDACGSDPAGVAAHASIDVSEVRHMAAVWQATKDEIATLTWLLGQGMSQRQAEDVYEEYGSGAVSLVQDDPYTLLGRVAGFGWETTDALAERLNVVGADPRRMRGGLTACVHKARSAGCTCENVAAAVAGAMALTATADRALMTEALDAAVRDKMVVRFGDGTDVGDFLATPWSMRCESAAWKALLRAADRSPWLADDDDPLATAERFRDLGGLTLDDTQVAAVANALKYRISVVTGGAGSGKCLGRGTPVMLHSGRVVPVENIEAGDLLMGPDSKPRRVLATNIGRGPLYRIKPIKGEPWVCNDVHIVTLKGTNKKAGQTVDVELSAHLKATADSRCDRDWKLFRVPIEFDKQGVLFDPYFIGVWLGDGSCDGARVHLGPKKKAVQDYVITEAKRIGLDVVVDPDPRSPGLDTVRFKGGTLPSKPLRDFLRAKCLTADGDKTIPAAYLYNTREVRLKVLAALIDTDGSLSGGGYDWCSVSKTLADQMVFLCRSLGFAAYVSIKSVKLDQWDTPRDYYRVSISGDLSELPLLVDSKKADPREQIKNHLVTGWTAESIGDGEFFGFTLDGDGRFLLGDFTVTHNTQLSKAIVNAFEDLGIPIYLAAPTGKAARRMTEVIGRPAKTIHRLLKFNGGTGQYGVDETCPLDHCLILVDECSMLDAEVAYRLFSAVGRRASLVLVGDPNQLPPVGPGSLLRDVLDHALAPTTRLDTVHRQAGALKENSIAILAGRVEPNVPMAGGAAPPWVVHQGVDTPDKARAVVASVYREQLAKWGYEGLADAQFMTAKHKGPFGTEYLNLYLQHLHQTQLGRALPEPTAESAAEGKPKLYVDDRVIQVKNDYELDVMNGEIGTVLSGAIARPRLLGLLGLTAEQRHDAPGSHLLAPIMAEEGGRRTICPTCLTPVELPAEGGWLPRRCGACGVDYVATDGSDGPDDPPPAFTLTADTPGATRALARRVVKNDTEPVADYVVRFPDRTVVYPAGTANDLHLAYCLSVHKMQGSQVPCAIVLVPKSHWFMQTRGWFYTAVTRAQKTAVILGDPDGIRKAAERVQIDDRKTILRVFATCEEARP